MVTEYLTISKEGMSLFKDRGSKFIGIALHVESEEEVKQQLEKLQKQYHDARHHCYAYMLGAKREVFRANDDGEPNHSAGDPILGQINSKELTDTLVVVVRYFGGTKLGVSGLINAYKTAAEEAISEAKTIAIEVKQVFELSYGYELTNEVMRLVNDFSINIDDQKFEANCMLQGRIRIDLLDQLTEKVQLLKDLGNAIEFRSEEVN
ncbi:MAG TPA: YigZ family protein [Fulvivirga sp.]|nr:YigZ family protein [Fulvivirga sp.]